MFDFLAKNEAEAEVVCGDRKKVFYGYSVGVQRDMWWFSSSVEQRRADECVW